MREKRDTSKRVKSLFVILFFVSLLPPFLSASPDEDSVLLDKIDRAILEIRAGKPSSMDRADAAERLEGMVRKVNPNKIDDKTIADITSLLNIQDDSVRLWVAASLGDLGPRASAVIPTLLKILPEVDCNRMGINSAPFIRVALKRIDGKEPPPPDCGTAKNNSMLLSQIKKGIIEVRNGAPHTVARSDAAEHLASLIKQIDPNAIDDVTLGDLIALLDIPDDAVRAWVAGALGDVGPRAHAAVPELLKILPEVDCVESEQMGLTSAQPIRYALKRIDGKEPPPPVCNGNNK